MKRIVKSTCCYCGVGCGLLVEAESNRIVGVRGDPDHPANAGRLCAKGASLHLTARSDHRLLHPELRGERGEPRQRVSWDDALDHASQRFAETIRVHGPDSVAFYVSGQLLTEDYYVFNKLAKGLIGTNNIDTNSRLCMSSAVAGYKQTLGADAPPCCYEDIGLADCLLIVGANPALAHPIVFRRIEDARAANPAPRLIVVDPRRSETAAVADLHLAIRPGTDIALLNGLLHILIRDGLIDRGYIARHTDGFAGLEAIVAGYSPRVVAEACGISQSDLERAAHWFGEARAALSLYCQGLNQSSHGTHNNAALIHLHLATGQIGRPGAGPFSLTGQPNAMGGREVGGMANLLSAHRDLANAEHRAEVARLWGVPSVPERPGKTAIELFAALRSGDVRAVWIACTNPAQSLPDHSEVRAALATAEFVVLQEAYADTDTAAFADLLLPATSWAEKEGTVTNSERCITHVVPAISAAGEARADWQIAVDFAMRLGRRLGNALAGQLLAYTHPEQIFNEHVATTHGRDLDISGLSYALLDERGPQQWPFPAGSAGGRRRLYGDGVFPTANGRARFVPVEHRSTAEVPDTRYPISLLSGRLRDQWHGMSRTGTVARLFQSDDQALLSMHPNDLSRRGLQAGDLVVVSNSRGRQTIRVGADAGLREGVAWLPMHWGNRFMNGAGANALTASACDPHSKQPELKHAAVTVERADLPWQLAILRLASANDRDLPDLLRKARALLADFPFASVTLHGRRGPDSRSLLVFRAAGRNAPEAERLLALDSLFGLDDHAAAIVYRDHSRRISKRAVVSGGRLTGVRLAGETLALSWLRDAMTEATMDPAVVRQAVAPLGRYPGPLPKPSRQVCRCADVTESEIAAEIAAGATLESLRETHGCTTYCGACLPVVKSMVAAGRAPRPALTT